MDKHIIPGIQAKHAAQAHREDIRIQDDYGCRCMTYWVDEQRGYAFCLIEAPDQAAVIDLHQEAHGLIPHEIIEVNKNIVTAFLGRINDPQGYHEADDPSLQIFNDPAFRVILYLQSKDATLLSNELSKSKSQELIKLRNEIVIEKILQLEGRQIEQANGAIVASFLTVSHAIRCTYEVLRALHIATDLIDLKMGIDAGIPIDGHPDFFGKTITTAQNLCWLQNDVPLVVSSIINELYKVEKGIEDHKYHILLAEDETFIHELFKALQSSYVDTNLSVVELGAQLSMSKSKLYRMCTALIGMSPNSLLKEYRLNQSLPLLRKGLNISEVSYECGFTSPSYFSKCFQDRFDMQPLVYQKESTAY